MSQTSFENFARVASRPNRDHTEVAGRYAFQAAAERRILRDVLNKLDLDADDALLEIGCGPGNLLIPLAHFVRRAVGIDTAPCLQRLRDRVPLSRQIECAPGNFMEIDLAGQSFDKILIYSVLHYLSSEQEVLDFVDRALALCAPGGRLLLGDLPNRDRKARFAASSAGQTVAREWQAQVSQAGGHAFDDLPTDSRLVAIDDKLVLALMARARAAGHESYLLAQPPDLPFGGSREDILIITRS